MATSLPPSSQSPAQAPGDEPATRALPALPVGARAEIVDVDASADPGGRLRDLGFLPGTLVRLLRRAPLGDPAVYALRGTRFCLRRAEARAVRVRPLPSEADETAP